MAIVVKRKDKEFNCQNVIDAQWLARIIASDYCGSDDRFRVECYIDDILFAYAVPNPKGGVWMYDADGNNLDMV